MMRVRIHKDEKRQTIIAVCDSEIQGKYFSEGNRQLDLRSDFYNGEEMEEDRIMKLFASAHIANLVGKKSVALGIKAKIIDEGHIIMIQGIPHAQAVIMR